jgi:nicotinate-nucleotide adenylyltransferase
LQLAIGGQESFRISKVELDRGGISYTVDTLEALHSQSPTAELCFLLGADSVRDFSKWREPRRICELATLLIACRPQSPLPDMATLSQQLGFESSAALRFERVDMPQVDISSTELRHRVKNGMSIRYRVPRAVEKYIEAQGLYLAASING